MTKMEEDKESMRKDTSKKSSKAWIPLLGIIVTIVMALIPYICVDFAMDFEKSPNTYLLLHNGAAIKNSNAEVYCIADIPIKNSKKKLRYTFSHYVAPFSNSEHNYRFDVGEQIREKAFSKIMTYLYYDNSDPYFYPDVKIYIRINYELSFIHNIEFHKWYRIDNRETKYVNLITAHNIEKAIVSQNQSSYSNFYEYYLNNRTIILNNEFDDSINEIKTKDNIDNLLSWIDNYRAKPISETERNSLKKLYWIATYS